MLISETYGFVFLSMPKCASVAIETMLAPYSSISLLETSAFRHTNFREYQRYFKPYLKEKSSRSRFETVCLMREPVSWLDSWYRFRARDELKNLEHPNHQNSTAGVSFTEFIEAYMSEDPPAYARLGSQIDFVTDETGQIGVDTIFRYEMIDQFVLYMGGKIGERLVLRATNISPSGRHDSGYLKKAVALTRYVRNRIGWRHPIRSKYTAELPGDLRRSLCEYLAEEFELYERVKRDRG